MTAWRFGVLGVLLVLTLVNLEAFQAAPAARVRTITLTAGDPVGEKMTYSLRQIIAAPGERLRIRLTSTGQLPKTAMAHNWVLLKIGTDPKRFTDAAAMAKDTDYIPKAFAGQIIAYTDLVGPGERTEVMVTVPKTPGTYPFVCTFAGHYAAGMSGELIVK